MSLPTLYEHFPTVQCGVVDRDNEFPALDWIRFACRNMTERFTEMGAWLEERINHSRYSFIPVGNLPGDAPLFMIDLLLAKSLQMKKQLVWYSDTGEPDLGGHEDRNFRSYFQEEVENPQMNNKGFYRNYSIEIDVETLASNTIL
jgi:DNA polymerase epsilon subunit 1